MCAYGEREGISVSGTAEKLRTECEKAQLGVEIENLSSMIGAAMHDKKRDGDELNIVLLKHFGEGFVKKIAINTLTDVVR